MIRRLLPAVAAGFFLRCAHVEPPPGGPADTVPPFVTAVYPAPGSRNVPLDAEFSLRFSEWIEPAAKRGKALLSPPASGFHVTVDGDRMLFRTSGLRANTAYRLTVIGSLKDLRGNPMGGRFSIAFTTGGDFDSGAVAGRLLVPEARGMILAALYPAVVEGQSAPSLGQPAFLAPADSLGGFAFDSVSQGSYAFIAFSDANGNGTPDPGLEDIGVGPAELQLAPRGAPQSLRLAALDTAALRVGVGKVDWDTADGSGTGSGIVRLQFSRPPHPGPASDRTFFSLNSKVGGDPVEVKSSGRDPATGEWWLETGALNSGAEYVLETRGLQDLSGIGVAPEAAASEFKAPVAPARDTTPWQLAFLNPPDMTGRDTLRSNEDMPIGNEFRLRSNKLLTSARLSTLQNRAEVRLDTLPPVAVEWRKLGPLTLTLKLTQASAAPNQGLRIRLKPRAPDTVAVLLLSGKTPDSMRLGQIRIRIPEPYKGWTLVLRGGWPLRETLINPPESGDTARIHTSAGPLRLSAFLDRNKDGVWHPGSLRPYLAQEPMVRILDSLTVPAGGTVNASEFPAR